MDPNPFETANAGFAQAIYEEYLRDPSAVTPEWRHLFESGVVGEKPVVTGNGKPPVDSRKAPEPVPEGLPAGATPMKGPAGRLAANMNESLGVPTATTYRQVPVAVLEARRKELNQALKAAGRDQKISFTHLIGYALALAAGKHPVMTNSFLEVDDAPHRVDPGTVNLGLAVDVERKDGSRGLVVPVIRDAEKKNFAEFLAAYEELVEKARSNRLMPDAFMGASMSLTNPGGLGTTMSMPRLMAGQGSIIAVGSIAYPPEFSTTGAELIRELGIAKIMTMSSTYDHRVIQGAESGEFLRTMDGLLQGDEGFYDQVFESLSLGTPAKLPALGIAPRKPGAAAAPSAEPAIPASQAQLGHVAAAMGLVKAFRTHGHLAAHLDPLGSEPIGDPALDPDTLGLTPEIMGTIPARVLRVAVEGETLADALPHLIKTYTGTIAYEVEHIASHEQRVWLREKIESGEFCVELPAEEKKALLERLTQVSAFESFLHKAYLGQKRFSIEGVDMLVPMLDSTIEQAAQAGAREINVGMAHRGRLNVLVHTVGRPYQMIIAEFEGSKAASIGGEDDGTGDVKYHLGAEGAFPTKAGHAVTVNLTPNPSHLEFVGPVVVGRARADQTQRRGREATLDTSIALPIVIHGDAAFAGQGVVAETFNLGALNGYRTGGTLHLITNNQIGFTTDMNDARSTRYASDLAKGFDIPIVHVNADDPEACLTAVRLAMAYREKFHEDVVIDLVGYRRHGHNEGDEPAYTQPMMYAAIRELPTVRERYAKVLVGDGVMSQEEVDQLWEKTYQQLVEVQQGFKSGQVSHPQEPKQHRGGSVDVDTAVNAELLRSLNDQLLTWPEGFTPNAKLARQLERRRQAIEGDGKLDWAHAEELALASLLVDGVPLRMTGQDTERGTFSQRHLVLHDAENGDSWGPIRHLPGATAPIELHNSPLSELATLGFEYGYSVAAPEALVLWEGQFGDFINGAQVIVDQFIASGLSKWGQTTRLTLLLPHGYEGQGPEHSSARLERFLQLAAEGNIRVANCTTPAQYFHLLRRQAVATKQRPLIVMTPKSLLRLPQAASSFEELTTGTFQLVIDDTLKPAGVERVVVCSGKVYYDLLAEAEKMEGGRPAIVRVEQLYTFPAPELRAALGRYGDAKEIVWCQEEPRNMGAWTYIEDKLLSVMPEGLPLRYAGRPERASPAEGYPAAHQAEQKRIVGDALAAVES